MFLLTRLLILSGNKTPQRIQFCRPSLRHPPRAEPHNTAASHKKHQHTHHRQNPSSPLLQDLGGGGAGAHTVRGGHRIPTPRLPDDKGPRACLPISLESVCLEPHPGCGPLSHYLVQHPQGLLVSTLASTLLGFLPSSLASPCTSLPSTPRHPPLQ